MTTADFLKLSDGERDEIVAEHVMGWRRYSRKEINNFGYGLLQNRESILSPVEPEMPAKPEMVNFFTVYVCAYTTDISAAWEVVEKMRENKVCLNVCHAFENFKTWKYFVTIQEMGKEPDYVEPQESAPLAISIAALICKGVLE